MSWKTLIVGIRVQKQRESFQNTTRGADSRGTLSQPVPRPWLSIALSLPELSQLRSAMRAACRLDRNCGEAMGTIFRTGRWRRFLKSVYLLYDQKNRKSDN